MHRTKGSNPLVTAWPLVVLAALYVPTSVQSQRSYGLISAIVDREDPNDGQDVFTLDTYALIEFAYIGNGISQIQALREDGTQKIARFLSLDYHTMILDVVVFDTGDPNRMTKCRFKNVADVKELYHFITSSDRIFQFNRIRYPVISVVQYDCTRADCGYGAVDDYFTDGSYYQGVIGDGTIYSDKGTRTVAYHTLMKRFFIRGEDGAASMMFTSKTINMTPVGRNMNVMMSIRTKYLSCKILIQFKDISTALRFKGYVHKNQDLDSNIPLDIPSPWQDLFS